MTTGYIEIPIMTDPLGRYWDQPKKEDILIDESGAIMTEKTFKQLAEYSCTIPTGVYDGKMWKSENFGEWWLCWYAPSDDPNKCSINRKKIFVI